MPARGRRHFTPIFLGGLFGQVDNFGVGSGFDRPNALLGVALPLICLAGGDDLAVAALRWNRNLPDSSLLIRHSPGRNSASY
jgi:hypothetical protein